MNTQPESLRLADQLENLEATGCGDSFSLTPYSEKQANLAAAELRRLYEENTALRKCATKYLDYLGIPDQENALDSDLKNKDMLKSTTTRLKIIQFPCENI